MELNWLKIRRTYLLSAYVMITSVYVHIDLMFNKLVTNYIYMCVIYKQCTYNFHVLFQVSVTSWDHCTATSCTPWWPTAPFFCPRTRPKVNVPWASPSTHGCPFTTMQLIWMTNITVETRLGIISSTLNYVEHWIMRVELLTRHRIMTTTATFSYSIGCGISPLATFIWHGLIPLWNTPTTTTIGFTLMALFNFICLNWPHWSGAWFTGYGRKL